MPTTTSLLAFLAQGLRVAASFNRMFFQAWGSRRNQPNAIGTIFARSDIDSDFKAAFLSTTLGMESVKKSGVGTASC